MSAALKLEVGHAVIYAHDIDAMIEFYTSVLGFEVTDRGPLAQRGPGVEIVFLSQSATAHHQLAFVNGRAEVGPSNSVDHVAFRSGGTIDDLRKLKARLESLGTVSNIRPVTHGNAWSVYFRDPEGNGVEIFIDTPWHVAQPQGKAVDYSQSDEEIVAWTQDAFRTEPEFGALSDFYGRRAEHLAQRAATAES